jgi:predicted secreted protein
MAQQNARELVIKRSTVPDGTGTRVFVCGLRTRSFTIANADIDSTVPNCDDPSLPIVATSAPGRQTLEFTGDGLADNDAVGLIIFDDARLQRRVIYEIIIPGYGTYIGPMAIYDWEFSGDMEEPMAFSATWRPTDAGELIYTPAAP